MKSPAPSCLAAGQRNSWPPALAPPKPPAARAPALDPAGIAHPRPRAKGQALWNPSLAFRRSAQAARAGSRIRLLRPERPRAVISLTKPRTPRPPRTHRTAAPPLLATETLASSLAFAASGACGGNWWNPVCPLLFAFTPPATARPTTTGPGHGSVTANRRRQKSAQPVVRPSIESSARTGPRLPGGVLRPHGPPSARQKAAARHSIRKLIPRLAVSGCCVRLAARRAPVTNPPVSSPAPSVSLSPPGSADNPPHHPRRFRRHRRPPSTRPQADLDHVAGWGWFRSGVRTDDE